MPLSSILRELDLIPTSLPPAVHLHVHGLPVPMPASPVPNRKCICLFPTLQADSSPSEPPGKPKNSGMGILSLLQGDLLTQESNQGLLDYRWIIYQLSFPAQGLNPALGAWSLSHWTTREVPLHVFLPASLPTSSPGYLPSFVLAPPPASPPVSSTSETAGPSLPPHPHAHLYAELPSSPAGTVIAFAPLLSSLSLHFLPHLHPVCHPLGSPSWSPFCTWS